MPGSDQVCRNIDGWAHRRLAALYALGDNFALQGEAYAKRNRPWTDRTGNARQGLFGYVLMGNCRLRVRVAHTVEYGVILELARSGKYAILGPTARRFAPEFFQTVSQRFGIWR